MPTARGPELSAIAMPPYVAVSPKGMALIMVQTPPWPVQSAELLPQVS